MDVVPKCVVVLHKRYNVIFVKQSQKIKIVNISRSCL